MKKLLASVAAIAVCASASAQNGGDSVPEAHVPLCDYTDGDNNTTWKLTNPSGPSDWWNSFKSTDCAGSKIDALAADFVETNGFSGSHAELGVYPDLGGGAPDVGNPIVSVANPDLVANDGFDTDNYYSIPATTLGSTAVHVAARYNGGDSHCWMSSDNDTNLGRTFFSTNSYTTGAVPFTVEIDMYFGAPHSGNPGDLLINGGTSATVQQNGTVCVDFIGSAVNTLFILYFCVNGNPFIQLLPLAFTQTDGFFGGSCPGTWQLCTSLNCNTPTASNLEFCTLWADGTDLKGNGKPKIKVGSSAFLTITADPTCGSSTSGSCFGQKDDCFVDLFIWKVTNPAGPSDWFNVNHGPVPSTSAGNPVNNLTAANVSGFDFCGIGPCWAEVGIYPANLTLDPSGTTPDVGNPIANVTGTSACMAVSAADGSCPITSYNTGTVPAPTGTTVHVAAQWPSGDSCIWLGSDTDGIDSPCGIAIPNDGTHSLFTGVSYTSPAAQFTGANWLMQIDWN